MDTTYYAFSIYDCNGNLQYSNSLASWFNITGGTGAGDVISDPWNQRFVLVSNNTSPFVVSVAQQMNALGNYCNYTFGTGINAQTSFLNVQAVRYDETYLYLTAQTNPSSPSPFTSLMQINLKQMESLMCDPEGHRSGE